MLYQWFFQSRDKQTVTAAHGSNKKIEKRKGGQRKRPELKEKNGKRQTQRRRQTQTHRTNTGKPTDEEKSSLR